MALEALCGQSRRPMRSELYGENTDNVEEENEFITAFPNYSDSMKILAPPFVSILWLKLLKWKFYKLSILCN